MALGYTSAPYGDFCLPLSGNHCVSPEIHLALRQLPEVWYWNSGVRHILSCYFWCMVAALAESGILLETVLWVSQAERSGLLCCWKQLSCQQVCSFIYLKPRFILLLVFPPLTISCHIHKYVPFCIYMTLYMGNCYMLMYNILMLMYTLPVSNRY